MDESRILIFMIIGALIVGAFVVIFNPYYRVDQILESNRRYYPQVHEETVKAEALVQEKLNILEKKKSKKSLVAPELIEFE